MKRTSYHILPRKTNEGLDWAIKKTGAERATAILSNKNIAIKQTMKLAKTNKLAQVIIHNKEGIIQEERTVNKDPKKYKG